MQKLSCFVTVRILSNLKPNTTATQDYDANLHTQKKGEILIITELYSAKGKAIRIVHTGIDDL